MERAPSSPPRLAYADALRCLASAAVVLLHCVGSPLSAADVYSSSFLVLNVLSSLTRWAVPMFVMLTGAFLLDPEKPLSTKSWLRHTLRIAAATFFWSLFYCLWYQRELGFTLAWLKASLSAFAQGSLHYHLWYLPMLLGLYLFLPVLRAFVRGAARRDLWYAVGLWTIFKVFLPTLSSFFPSLPGLSWLTRFEFWNILGYSGWLLLGYLLRTCSLSRRRGQLLLLAGALSAVLTPVFTALLSRRDGILSSVFYGNCSPTVLFMTAGIFFLFREKDLGKRSLWSRLAPLTFGVYLLHPLILELCQNYLRPFSTPSLPDSLLCFALTLPLSFLLSALLRRLPLAKTWLF